MQVSIAESVYPINKFSYNFPDPIEYLAEGTSLQDLRRRYMNGIDSMRRKNHLISW